MREQVVGIYVLLNGLRVALKDLDAEIVQHDSQIALHVVHHLVQHLIGELGLVGHDGHAQRRSPPHVQVIHLGRADIELLA